MKIILSVLIIALSSTNFAQKGLEKELRQFYLEINNGDKEKVSSCFLSTASIVKIQYDSINVMSVNDFLANCPKFAAKQFRQDVEKIELIKWTGTTIRYKVDLKIYENGKLIKFGVDEITLLRSKNNDYFIDKIYSETQEYQDVIRDVEDVPKEINKLMNSWHLNASESNLDSYFEKMHPEFIFLGTDPSERWTKNEFYKFCAPYFEKKTTWDFKTNWRNVYVSKDRNTAWFEESLDTWMNESRGSGVFVKVDKKWKLIHYNLTVLIENEKMKKFLKLRSK